MVRTKTTINRFDMKYFILKVSDYILQMDDSYGNKVDLYKDLSINFITNPSDATRNKDGDLFLATINNDETPKALENEKEYSYNEAWSLMRTDKWR